MTLLIYVDRSGESVFIFQLMIFVLNIDQLPEVEVKDQPDNNSIAIEAKPQYPNSIYPLTFISSQTEFKNNWLTEIARYISDPVALHEHNVDDLRIDPTQIKPDSEYEELRLPIQRKGSYQSDGIRPSEVAKDYFLTDEERQFYAKQHLGMYNITR